MEEFERRANEAAKLLERYFNGKEVTLPPLMKGFYKVMEIMESYYSRLYHTFVFFEKGSILVEGANNPNVLLRKIFEFFHSVQTTERSKWVLVTDKQGVEFFTKKTNHPLNLFFGSESVSNESVSSNVVEVNEFVKLLEKAKGKLLYTFFFYEPSQKWKLGSIKFELIGRPPKVEEHSYFLPVTTPSYGLGSIVSYTTNLIELITLPEFLRKSIIVFANDFKKDILDKTKMSKEDVESILQKLGLAVKRRTISGISRLVPISEPLVQLLKWIKFSGITYEIIENYRELVRELVGKVEEWNEIERLSVNDKESKYIMNNPKRRKVKRILIGMSEKIAFTNFLLEDFLRSNNIFYEGFPQFSFRLSSILDRYIKIKPVRFNFKIPCEDSDIYVTTKILSKFLYPRMSEYCGKLVSYVLQLREIGSKLKLVEREDIEIWVIFDSDDVGYKDDPFFWKSALERVGIKVFVTEKMSPEKEKSWESWNIFSCLRKTLVIKEL